MWKVVGALCVAASVVHADPAVEKAVRTNLEAAAHGNVDSVEYIDNSWAGVGELKIAPFTPRITVDAANRVAYFAADLVVSGELGTGFSAELVTKGKWSLRANGVLIEDHGWKVVGEKLSLVASDKALTSDLDSANWRLDPDPISTQIAAWFPGKLGAHRATSATAAYVTGTSPTDVARDAVGLAKLVTSWDKLKLTARYVESQELAGGKLLWAIAVVELPVKGGVKDMKVGIVAVPEGGQWRWVSLNWSPELQPDHCIR